MLKECHNKKYQRVLTTQHRIFSYVILIIFDELFLQTTSSKCSHHGRCYTTRFMSSHSCVLPQRYGFGIKQLSRGFLKRFEEATGAKIQLSNKQQPTHWPASRSRYKCLHCLLRLSKVWNKFSRHFLFKNSKKPCSLRCNTATRTCGDRWRARVHEGKWILHAKPKRHWLLLIGSDEKKPRSNGTRRIETALQTYICLEWCFFYHPQACCCLFYHLPQICLRDALGLRVPFSYPRMNCC